MPQTPTAQAGANIRAEMARRGISQVALAAKIKRPQPWLSKRLRGVIPLNINELLLIAAALDVPLDALLDGVAELEAAG